MKNFAKTIKLAAKIKEESYDHKAAEKAKNTLGYIDFSRFYKKSLKDSIEEAVQKTKIDKEARFPIYLLLECCWNDILDWVDQDKFK
jgi:hypothetical protein